MLAQLLNHLKACLGLRNLLSRWHTYMAVGIRPPFLVTGSSHWAARVTSWHGHWLQSCDWSERETCCGLAWLRAAATPAVRLSWSKLGQRLLMKRYELIHENRGESQMHYIEWNNQTQRLLTYDLLHFIGSCRKQNRSIILKKSKSELWLPGNWGKAGRVIRGLSGRGE